MTADSRVTKEKFKKMAAAEAEYAQELAASPKAMIDEVMTHRLQLGWHDSGLLNLEGRVDRFASRVGLALVLAVIALAISVWTSLG